MIKGTRTSRKDGNLASDDVTFFKSDNVRLHHVMLIVTSLVSIHVLNFNLNISNFTISAADTSGLICNQYKMDVVFLKVSSVQKK